MNRFVDSGALWFSMPYECNLYTHTHQITYKFLYRLNIQVHDEKCQVCILCKRLYFYQIILWKSGGNDNINWDPLFIICHKKNSIYHYKYCAAHKQSLSTQYIWFLGYKLKNQSKNQKNMHFNMLLALTIYTALMVRSIIDGALVILRFMECWWTSTVIRNQKLNLFNQT